MSQQIGAKRSRYDVGLVEEAANLVRSNSISLSKASKDYGIPKTTLHNKVQYKYGGNQLGRKTELSTEEESRIVQWTLHMSRIGYGRTRKELVNVVKKILDEDDRVTRFKDNRPGRDWLRAFFKRHPRLTIRTTLQLGKERAIISAEKVNRWFTDFQTYLENEVGDANLMKDPSRIYNADESGFSLCAKNSQVIGCKGAPVVYNYSNSDKTQLTVMAAASASGHYIPPMIIFPGQRFSYNPLEGFEEAALGRSESGWMDADVFSNWLANVFIPAVEARKVKKPVLLFIDGHSTHVTMAASDTCVENGIEMYCLLEHASHVMQPLDLKLFGSLKQAWRLAVREWQMEHIGQFVTKMTFARVFKTAWTRSTTTDAAVKGFQEAGLFPLNPSQVMQSVKLEPSTIFAVDSRTAPSVESLPGTLVESGPGPSVESRSNASVESRPGLSVESRPGPSVESRPDASVEPRPGLSVESCPDASVESCPDASVEPRPCLSVESRTNASVESPTGPSVESRPGALVESPTGLSNPPAAERGTGDKQPTCPPSPFIKYLQYPQVTNNKPSQRSKPCALPKAITGNAYREYLQEKKLRKEQEENAKAARKEERIRKRKQREAEKEGKRLINIAKKKARELVREKRMALREKMLSQSDSDDDHPYKKGNCYTCDKPYADDHVTCTNCKRPFHLQCVLNEYVNATDELPFECKYC